MQSPIKIDETSSAILDQVISRITNRNLSFLMGAGISVNSGIPMVGNIKNNEIIDGIETYILSKLDFSIEEVSVFLNTIPFETFFEVLIDNGLDMKMFVNVFKSQPSIFHNVTAKLVQKGMVNSIATTNFDNCIELALGELGIVFSVHSSGEFDNKNISQTTIRKFHGTIDDINGLGISIKNISNKLGFEKRKHDIEDYIEEVDCIIVCGYSCSDIFDLTPIFDSYKNPNSKKIIFISHTNDKKIEIITSNTDSKFDKIYNMFGNYNLEIVQCNTDYFIETLARKFNITNIHNTVHRIDWKQYIDNCINEFNELKKHKIRGNLFYKIGENEKSINCLIEALSFAKTDEDKLACQRSIAWTYAHEGNMPKAQEILLPFLKEYAELMDNYSVHFANILYTLGVCYTNTDYKKARCYYLQGLELCRKHGLKREEGYTLVNLGELYETCGKYDKAIVVANKAVLILADIGYIDAVGICYSNLSKYYFKKEKYVDAMTNIEKAIDIATKLGEIKVKNTRMCIKAKIEDKLKK